MINGIMRIVQPALSLSTEIIKIQYNAHGRKETTLEKTLARWPYGFALLNPFG